MENYNVAQLFDIAFGIKSIGTYSVENINTAGLQVAGSLDYATQLSHLGTPMIVPILFKGSAAYKIYNDFGDIVTDSYEDFALPAATLVNFRRAKIISKTKASAVASSVKEIFAFDDWKIDIRGFVWQIQLIKQRNLQENNKEKFTNLIKLLIL
jgi:hypothetical protein